MSWELIVGVVIVALGAWIIRQQAQEIGALRIRAEEAEAWSGYWQQQAEAGDVQRAALAAKHDQLQRLYGQRTRELLAANSWLITVYQRRRS